MNIKPSSGVLLHPTAIPNKLGIGDLGYDTYKFIDLLAQLKQSYWQILPLTIPEKGNSPYSPLSSFAGNPLLISPQILVEDNLLAPADLTSLIGYSDSIDYASLILERENLLRKAMANFSLQNQDFIDFSKNPWLDDYSLFISLYEKNNQQVWSQWPEEERNPSNSLKKQLKIKLASQIAYHKFVQYLFYKQWKSLKAYANSKGIQIIGDIPIYVSYNSADVWANKELFQLGSDYQAQFISGCPPDSFNEDGQIWENPLYDWSKNKESGYTWWIDRISYNLEICDVLRLDHFIGFTRYWSIPAKLYDAKAGEWKQGPGADFLHALQKAIPQLKLIAEDLGSLSPQVTQLKEQFNLPGMIVLHYALDDWEFANANLPHKSFIYTGTHDNNTSKGWWKDYAYNHDIIKNNFYKSLAQARENSDFIINEDSVAYDLIELAYASNCLVAIIPLQDMLNLDENYRMNRPGTAQGNWAIRIPQAYASTINQEKILGLINRYHR
jgi:4-alpha-glucanotransferase